jgi:hypothetical protein
VPLDGAWVDMQTLGVDAGGDHVGALVHVGEEEGRADAGLGVQARAAIAVPTRPDLEVERAVNPVLLRPEYRSQVFRHCYCLSLSRGVCFDLGMLVVS